MLLSFEADFSMTQRSMLTTAFCIQSLRKTADPAFGTKQMAEDSAMFQSPSHCIAMTIQMVANILLVKISRYQCEKCLGSQVRPFSARKSCES